MKFSVRILLLIAAFISLTGIIGGGIFVHQHSGQGSGGQTLTGTTINNPIITGATLTGTINNPTITGTITGTPAWASGQTFPSIFPSFIELPNNNTPPSGVGGIYQGVNTIQVRGGTSGFSVNNNANSLVNFSVSDAGTATARTSIVTPLVSSGGAGAIQIGNTNGTWPITAGAGGAILPPNDNTESFGSASKRLLSVFTPIIDSGTTGQLALRANNGETILTLNRQASPVNSIDAFNSPTGNPVLFRANGSDTDVSFDIRTKGAGSVSLRTDGLSSNVIQFQAIHTASASRNITVTGSNGGDPTISTTAGSLNVGTTLTSSKACATNYTRVSPNFCRAQGGAVTNWTNATACTTRTLTQSVPSDAKAVLLRVYWQALANNAIAHRSNTVQFFSDGACANVANGAFSEFSVREFAAVAAGTLIASTTVQMIVPLTTTNTIAATQTNAGGNGNSQIAQVLAAGYYD